MIFYIDIDEEWRPVRVHGSLSAFSQVHVFIYWIIQCFPYIFSEYFKWFVLTSFIFITFDVIIIWSTNFRLMFIIPIFWKLGIYFYLKIEFSLTLIRNTLFKIKLLQFVCSMIPDTRTLWFLFLNYSSIVLYCSLRFCCTVMCIICPIISV